MTNAEKYSYRVLWSEEDGEYVGLCAEFPSLSWLAASQPDALSGIVKLVRGVLKDMARSKEPIPEPIPARKYKGNIAVRVPPDLHRELALEAAEQNISINRLISRKLAR